MNDLNIRQMIETELEAKRLREFITDPAVVKVLDRIEQNQTVAAIESDRLEARESARLTLLAVRSLRKAIGHAVQAGVVAGNTLQEAKGRK